jgi:Protein of unknown function (DUF2786)
MNDMNQTQPQIDPALVARIRKLLNLGKDGAASENEREQATAKAQEFMLLHNISIATVEANAHDTSTVVKRRKESAKGFAMYAWQKNLMGVVATSNFCFVTTESKWTGYQWMTTGHSLVGREENVVSALAMFEYLRATTERLAQDYVGGDYRKKMSKEAMSFKAGCADRISERVRAHHRQQLAEQRAAATATNAAANTGTALVPIMEDFAEAEKCANEDFRLNLAPGTTAHRRFVAKCRSKAIDSTLDHLGKAFAGIIDKAMLRQAAEEAASNALSVSLGADELAEAVKDVVDVTAEVHLNQFDPSRKRKSGGGGGRRYARYSSNQGASINYGAHDAGRRAGNNVGLDKQVSKGSTDTKRIK